jgi:hypothetical protein
LRPVLGAISGTRICGHGLTCRGARIIVGGIRNLVRSGGLGCGRASLVCGRLRCSTSGLYKVSLISFGTSITRLIGSRLLIHTSVVVTAVWVVGHFDLG